MSTLRPNPEDNKEVASAMALFSLIFVIMVIVFLATRKGHSAEPARDSEYKAPVSDKQKTAAKGLASPGLTEAEEKARKRLADLAAEQAGQMLFFDAEVLSFDGNAQQQLGKVSCATCHIPDKKFGYSDGRKLAVPVGANRIGQLATGPLGQRNTKGLLRVASLEKKLVNSDGRVKGLFAQCFQAVTDPNVMAMPSIQAMVDRAAQRPKYRELMQLAFGSPEVTEARLRTCMVMFLRKLRYDDLPADRLAAGLQVDLPPSAIRGEKVFKRHCTTCHDPANDWRDDDFHNIGMSTYSSSLAQVNGQNPTVDLGRGAVTQNANDNFKFATPTIAGVPLTAPYMHDGVFKTLHEVIAYFQSGGRFYINGVVVRDPTIDPLVAAISFSKQDAADLEDYLVDAFQKEDYPLFEDPRKKQEPPR